MENSTYCIDCDKRTAYDVETNKVTKVVRGIEFSYVEHRAYCCECGAETDIDEINDANIDAAEDAYRKAAHLISVEEIERILKKYNIGAGPLAKVMGYGEIAINRYVGGQLPSKAHSDQLYEILNSHTTMLEKLESKKDSISPVAYQKCREAINNLDELYGSKKIELIARYILNKEKDVSPLALQKLLYFAQAFFMAIYKVPLFEDDCQAWAYGPVYPEIYKKYKDYGYNPIDKCLPEDDGAFTELTNRELNLIDSVIEIFGAYSGKTLSEITHSERPWLEARGELLPSDRSVTIINRDIINEYFSAVVDKYQIINPCDIKKYCTDMVSKII